MSSLRTDQEARHRVCGALVMRAETNWNIYTTKVNFLPSPRVLWHTTKISENPVLSKWVYTFSSASVVRMYWYILCSTPEYLVLLGPRVSRKRFNAYNDWTRRCDIIYVAEVPKKCGPMESKTRKDLRSPLLSRLPPLRVPKQRKYPGRVLMMTLVSVHSHLCPEVACRSSSRGRSRAEHRKPKISYAISQKRPEHAPR